MNLAAAAAILFALGLGYCVGLMIEHAYWSREFAAIQAEQVNSVTKGDRLR